MPLEIAGVVKDAHNIDHVPAAAVDQKVPGRVDNAQVVARTVPTEGQVVRPDAARQFRAVFGSWPLRIGSNVANSLLQKIAVARGRALAKALPAPN